MDHMPSKVWGEISYPFLDFNGGTVEWISSFIFNRLLMIYPGRYTTYNSVWPSSDHSRQPVALTWEEGSHGLVSTLFFSKIICSQNWQMFFFSNENYLFQIKWNRIISKYKRMHILLTSAHLACRGVPVTGMLAGMNLSKPGMNLLKPGINLSKPGKKHNNHVMISI